MKNLIDVNWKNLKIIKNCWLWFYKFELFNSTNKNLKSVRINFKIFGRVVMTKRYSIAISNFLKRMVCSYKVLWYIHCPAMQKAFHYQVTFTQDQHLIQKHLIQYTQTQGKNQLIIQLNMNLVKFCWKIINFNCLKTFYTGIIFTSTFWHIILS